MDKNSNSKKFIKRLLSAMLVVAVLVGGIVYVFDPFYHYHKPWFGLKAVLTDKEYQCIGTLRISITIRLLLGLQWLKITTMTGMTKPMAASP